MAADTERAESQQFGTIVIVGGGCYGTYYVRQLRRAREKGALAWRRLVVVDRDAACSVGRDGGRDIEFHRGEWDAFFVQWLGAEARRTDAIVPSPLMPHLFFQWIAGRARARWPGRAVRVEATAEQDGIPWQRGADDGVRYVSFATWMCPVNCIEPAICPHTRGPRDWSMPVALARATAAGSRALLFPCTHRAFGVGMIDAADLLDADQTIAGLSATRPERLVVGTISHCHGALGTLVVE